MLFVMTSTMTTFIIASRYSQYIIPSADVDVFILASASIIIACSPASCTAKHTYAGNHHISGEKRINCILLDTSRLRLVSSQIRLRLAPVVHLVLLHITLENALKPN